MIVSYIYYLYYKHSNTINNKKKGPRRFNNDHIPMNLDYNSFRNSGTNNNNSSVPTRYNDVMMHHSNRRSNRIV